jgi:class 3 adenylate cyclase
VSGDCTLASLQLEGRLLRVLVGEAVDRAEAVTAMASPGTIRISPETFALLQEDIVGMPHWMVTTEYEGDCMTAASLTLPPRGNAQLSTFAGLGLT